MFFPGEKTNSGGNVGVEFIDHYLDATEESHQGCDGHACPDGHEGGQEKAEEQGFADAHWGVIDDRLSIFNAGCRKPVRKWPDEVYPKAGHRQCDENGSDTVPEQGEKQQAYKAGYGTR